MSVNIKALLEKLKSGVVRLLSANVINKAVGMISTMIIMRLLTKNEYGIWGYALNIYSYLLLITGFGLVSGGLQFGTENQGKGKAYSYFRYCIKTGVLIDSAIVVIAEVAVCLIHLPIDGSKPYVTTLIPILIPEYLLALGQAILRAQNRIKEYARVLNINTFLIMVGTCGGAVFGIKGIIVGRYISCLLSIYMEFRLIGIDVKGIKESEALSREEKVQLWHYSIFTGLSSAMNCLVYSLDVTLIAELIKNASDIGDYKAGATIPNALQFIPVSVVISILPTVIYNRKDIKWVRKYLKKVYLGMIAVNLVISAGILLFAPFIIRLISGNGYEAAVPVLRILTLGYFFSGTFRNLSCNLLASFRRVSFGLFISVMTCVLDLVLNYIMIKEYGMIGAAYATLIVDIIAAILSFGYLLFIIIKGNVYEGD